MTKGNRLLLVALFISPLGLAAQGLPGDWKMSALDQTGNPVPTTLNFTENGTYRIDYGADGTVETQGTYTLDQNEGRITIQDTQGSNCTEQGIYAFTVDRQTLIMTRISEGCTNRHSADTVFKLERGE